MTKEQMQTAIEMFKDGLTLAGKARFEALPQEDQEVLIAWAFQDEGLKINAEGQPVFVETMKA